MTPEIEFIQAQPASKSTLSRLVWVAPLAILASTVANLGLYAAAGNFFPSVTAWTGASQGQIIGANFVYLLIGTIVFTAVVRLSSRPAGHYFIVATIGLLLSLALPISAGFGYGPPNTLPADIATVVTLCLMHVLSYVISVPLFIRLALG